MFDLKLSKLSPDVYIFKKSEKRRIVNFILAAHRELFKDSKEFCLFVMRNKENEILNIVQVLYDAGTQQI